MADTLALTYLYNTVTARFASEDPTIAFYFGWREPTHQLVSPRRIVWVPGNPAGAVGELKAARFPGQNPRPLGTLDELFTCYVTAQDPTAPENEAAQYAAARFLLDALLRALYLAAHGVTRVRAIDWETDKSERRFGATVRLVGSIEAMVPDTAIAVAPVDTQAVIDVTELDVTEQLTVTP